MELDSVIYHEGLEEHEGSVDRLSNCVMEWPNRIDVYLPFNRVFIMELYDHERLPKVRTSLLVAIRSRSLSLPTGFAPIC